MSRKLFGIINCIAGTILAGASHVALAQPTDADDPIADLVSRLELETYKSTLKGLTQFGDRRQGTSRNSAAVDWIEEQLISYGCSNVERLHYTFTTRPRGTGRQAAADTPDLTRPPVGVVRSGVSAAARRPEPREREVNV